MQFQVFASFIFFFTSITIAQARIGFIVFHARPNCPMDPLRPPRFPPDPQYRLTYTVDATLCNVCYNIPLTVGQNSGSMSLADIANERRWTAHSLLGCTVDSQVSEAAGPKCYSFSEEQPPVASVWLPCLGNNGNYDNQTEVSQD